MWMWEQLQIKMDTLFIDYIFNICVDSWICFDGDDIDGNYLIVNTNIWGQYYNICLFILDVIISS